LDSIRNQYNIYEKSVTISDALAQLFCSNYG